MSEKKFALRRNTMIKNGLCIGLILFLFAGTIFAQSPLIRNDMPPQGQQEGPGGLEMGAERNGPSRVPPKIAIDVCTGKSEGTTCEFTDPRGTKSGSCVYTPDKKYFACRPNDMHMSPQGRQEGQGGPKMEGRRN